jgi:hypothetical protein
MNVRSTANSARGSLGDARRGAAGEGPGGHRGAGLQQFALVHGSGGHRISIAVGVAPL